MPTIYVLSKNKKKYQHFSTENFHFFYNLKHLCILHGQVFVMKLFKYLSEVISKIEANHPYRQSGVISVSILWRYGCYSYRLTIDIGKSCVL